MAEKQAANEIKKCTFGGREGVRAPSFAFISANMHADRRKGRNIWDIYARAREKEDVEPGSDARCSTACNNAVKDL